MNQKEILNKWNNDFNTYNMPSGTLDEKADIKLLNSTYWNRRNHMDPHKIKNYLSKTIVPESIKKY